MILACNAELEFDVVMRWQKERPGKLKSVPYPRIIHSPNPSPTVG